MNLREPYVQKGILGIVLVIALLWLIFFTGFLPFSRLRTQDRVEALRQELQAEAGELQRIQAAVRRLPTLKAELEQLQKKWELLRDLLPKATEMSGLLSDVTTAGMRAGVEFTLFQPGEPEPAGLYTRYPIRVSVIGGYHQVGRFFENLCNMDRLVGISQVSVVQRENGAEAATVEASATILAYTYTETQQTAKPETSRRKGR